MYEPCHCPSISLLRTLKVLENSTRPFIDARPFLVSINLLYKVADNLTAIRAATRREGKRSGDGGILPTSTRKLDDGERGLETRGIRIGPFAAH